MGDTQRVAIITGASRGIGRAIARGLAEEGIRLVLASRNAPMLDATAEELSTVSPGVLPVPTDMSNEQDVSNLFTAAQRKYGRIDILVNNAGVGYFRSVAELSVEEFDMMWKVNLRGAFLASRLAIPHMVAMGGGHIFNIASLAGKNSFKGGAGYCATKWALRAFAQCLMLEVRDSNIRVTTLFPGSVETGFADRIRKGGKITQPEDVASAVVFALRAPERSMFSEIDVRPTHPQ